SVGDWVRKDALQLAMASSEEIETVIKEIFSHEDRDYTLDKWTAPTFADLQHFGALIVDNASEEQFQLFVERVPSMLAGAVHWGADDNFLGMISKPRVGDLYADFATFVISQGGASITLVEIEKPNSVMFTRSGMLTGDLRTADSQVEKWRAYLRTNQKAFVREIVDRLCKAPMYSEATDGTFRTRPPEDIQSGWQGFGGYDYEVVRFLVVCGRWSQMSFQERKWFLASSTDRESHYKLRTFEQLARDAFTGIYVCPTY
ncbi:MAG: DUF4263 domain-containing protein, partial [Armatimonadetes bacterium]|nr:DUF4263 domain-containing protein [Armatimonadota bacterium]